jgi:AraC-like DNA-binding protein
VTVPGEVYGYAHEEHDEAPLDVCLAICFTERAQEDITAHAVRALARHVPFVPLNNRRAYLRQRLLASLDGAPALTIESIAGELLFGALEGSAGHLYRPSQLEWYVRRIDAARQAIDEDFASEHTLSRLAAVAGMSPYHFARVFRDLVGTPPHRYVVDRRLSAAAAMLMSGASVTESCYAVGFQSLSHFITRFRLRFGISPSRFAREGRRLRSHVTGGPDTKPS